METPHDSSARSMDEADEEYYIDEEQIRDYGVPAIQDAGGTSSASNKIKASEELRAVINEGNFSPTLSDTRSVSSKSSRRQKERKPDRLFETAQKAILQAQEILQTLSLESSSSSSTDQAPADVI